MPAQTFSRQTSWGGVEKAGQKRVNGTAAIRRGEECCERQTVAREVRALKGAPRLSSRKKRPLVGVYVGGSGSRGAVEGRQCAAPSRQRVEEESV